MLLDEILEHVFSEPFAALGFAVVALAAMLSPMAVVTGLLFYLVAKKIRYSIFYSFGLFCLSLLLSTLLYHLNMTQYVQLGFSLWPSVFEGDIGLLFHPKNFITAIPIASLLVFALLLFDTLRSDFCDELRRLSQGKGKVREKKISAKKLAKRLASIKTAAFEHGSVIGLSQKDATPVILFDQNANLHTLAIGTTGSGKTTAISNIMESAIIRGLPLIVVDGKGDTELMRKVERYSKQHQRKFYGFSMVGDSVKYNPLASGGVTSKKDRIIELREWSEDHYRKLAEGYLQTVFQILEQASITTDLIQLSKYMELPALRELLQTTSDPKLQNAFQRLANKADDISSLKAEIENLVNSEIGHLFDCRQGRVLTLPKALRENAIIYFCLQPLAFPAYANCLGKLIINDIKALAASALENADKKIIYTIFDEFSVFAGDQIVNLINQGRGAGIHAILSTQSLSDLSRAGGEAFVGQVLNNCNNYLIQRQNNPDDAETLAKVVGTKDQFQFTSQVSSTMASGAVGTVKSVKEYFIHPDEIKRLGLGEGYYVNKQRFEMIKLRFRQGLTVKIPKCIQ